MKKLSLEMLRLTSEEVLERSQMKKITGGYGSVSIYCTCMGSSGPYGGWAGSYGSMDIAFSVMLNRCGGNGGCVLQ